MIRKGHVPRGGSHLASDGSPSPIPAVPELRGDCMRTTWRIDWVNWPVTSQNISRRNAQRAAIAIAQRRREREAVQRFLDELESERRAGGGPAALAQPGPTRFRGEGGPAQVR
jgi:hypothetical protein